MQGRPRQGHDVLEKFKALEAAAVPNTQGPLPDKQTFTGLRPTCLSSCYQHNMSGFQDKLTKRAKRQEKAVGRDGTKTRLRRAELE